MTSESIAAARDEAHISFTTSPIRVAHVLRKYDPCEWAGTETAVHDLLTGLREHQVQSVVYAPNLPNTEMDLPNTMPDPLIQSGFTVRRFRSLLPILGAHDRDRKRLMAMGGNIISFDAPWKLLREPALDVIHSHALNRIGGAARLIARRRNIPFVVTIHGGYLDLPKDTADKLAAPARRSVDYGRAFGWLVRSRRVVEDADAVITINPREAELLRAKFPRLRVELIPHGIPARRYAEDHRDSAMTEFPFLQGQTILLFVGRIDAVKNQGFVIEQMHRIRKLVPNAILVLAGPVTDTAYEQHLRALIRARGLDHCVFITGALAPGDPRLVGLYQCAHLFILPSLAEPFGLVMLEAWASGCPVVAGATSGAKQLVRPGENGYLFDVDDVNTFFDALRRAFASEEHRKALGEAGRRRVHSVFDTNIVAQRVHDLYAELCAHRRRSS